MRQELAIIGGGAKAAAIAAKAWALREARRADIHVTIFERHALAANWDGAHGYTDGIQPLCTPAQRDLGFPYETASYGEEVATLMHAQFSWSAFAVRDAGTPDYSDWVDHGTPRATHRQFAAYLRDAIERSGARVERGNVVALRHDRDWSVQFERKDGSRATASGFDGVVVTSPGPARPQGTLIDPRYLDGVSFWHHLGDVRDRVAASYTAPGRQRVGTPPIVILGAGGTAAAVAAWFVNAGFHDADMLVVANQPTFYTRIANFFENRVFSDDAAWDALGDDDRIAFNQRLTRGAVWHSVTETLERATSIRFRTAYVENVYLGPDPGDGSSPELLVSATRGSETPALIAVNTTGFDACWFASLLAPTGADQARTLNLEATMRPDLSVAIPRHPRLHAPTLAGAVGPGFTSLMVLGAMSDNLLRPYVRRSKGH